MHAKSYGVFYTGDSDSQVGIEKVQATASLWQHLLRSKCRTSWKQTLCLFRRQRLWAVTRVQIVKLRRGVAAKFADGDIKGAMRLLASPDSVEPHNDITIHQVLYKYPTAPEKLTLPAARSGIILLCHAGRRHKKTLTFLFPGSASKPDGLRPEHLQTFISGKAIEAR